MPTRGAPGRACPGVAAGPMQSLPTIEAMSRDREAGATAPRPTLPWLALTLLGVAGVAALLGTHDGLPGLFAALALLLTAAACALAGAAWSRLGQADRLREARIQQQLLGQLVDAWVWQTDREHRLVRLQPPQGAPASSWVECGASGELLWERFADPEATLRQRLQAQVPLPELQVLQAHGGAPGAPARHWWLRGLPRLDGRGGFAGYLGVARPIDGTEARSGAPDGLDDAQSLAAEHASFSYTVSHDLRAPIRVIDGFSRILKEDYGATLDRVGNDHLDRVIGAAARMNLMIDAMLSLSRLSTQPLARQPVNLSQLAQYVVDDLRRGAPQRTVAVRIEPGLASVGDPTLLRIALDNLLGNAWKYSAKCAHAEISFEQVEQAGRKAYRVRDNGAGFDMRFADRLFGVFQRLHSSSDFAGTGVGLASVRRIVRRHGGEIWAESEVGQGASFYFTLQG